MHSPFLRPDACGDAEIIADYAVTLLAERGVARLSSAAIARSMKVTPQALGQQVGGRARIYELLLIAFGRRWLGWSARPGWNSDLPARLPADQDEIHGVRVWQALRELARGELAAGNPTLQRHVTWVHREEREMLAHELRRLLDRPVLDEELDWTAALISGLQTALADPDPRLTHEGARRVLTRHLDVLRRTQADEAA
jgi:AcrR family transcriptional regulator